MHTGTPAGGEAEAVRTLVGGATFGEASGNVNRERTAAAGAGALLGTSRRVVGCASCEAEPSGPSAAAATAEAEAEEEAAAGSTGTGVVEGGATGTGTAAAASVAALPLAGGGDSWSR